MINAGLWNLLLFLHQNQDYMADNYLEKKMEEHRRGGVISASRRLLTPSGDRSGTVSFRIDPLKIYVTDVSNGYSDAIVSRLRDTGGKVAFSSADDKAGRILAQKSGARFYPASFTGDIMSDLERVWGSVDTVIITYGKMPENVDLSKLKRIIFVGAFSQEQSIPSRDGLTVNAVNIIDRKPAEVAHLCLLLCLKDSSVINNLIL